MAITKYRGSLEVSGDDATSSVTVRLSFNPREGSDQGEISNKGIQDGLEKALESIKVKCEA